MTFVLKPPTIRPQRLHDRRLEGQYRVFDVVHHEVEDATGRALHGVYTFECRDWCNIVARTLTGELVLIWQYRYGTMAMELETPGGVIEPGEDPEATARRELREETGYEAARFESLGRVAPNPALQGNLCHLFLAHDARLTAATKFDEHEDIEVVLVPEQHVRALIDREELRHSLAIVALERALKRLGVS